MKVYAPGKLILSGEHAVLYGQPALAMAVNRFASVTITPHALSDVSFDLLDLAHRSRLSLSSLQKLKERVKRKYHKFIRGEYTIRQVLNKPFELAHIAFGILSERFHLPLQHGVNIQVQSDIPMGCGMGSSAATIVSVMYAISRYLELPVSQETLFQLALEAEHLQHGYSSGLDLRVATQGGCLYMHEGRILERAVPTLPIYLIQTGTPLSTTGECVQAVSRHFKSAEMRDDFATVTNAMDAAMQFEAWPEVKRCIRLNHRLLKMIGVVPHRVDRFIAEVEKTGGVAKICGAGAVTGDKGGAVLVMTTEKPALAALCLRYGYSCTAISGVSRGVYAA